MNRGLDGPTHGGRRQSDRGIEYGLAHGQAGPFEPAEVARWNGEEKAAAAASSSDGGTSRVIAVDSHARIAAAWHAP